jgi:predicted amidohydrolase
LPPLIRHESYRRRIEEAVHISAVAAQFPVRLSIADNGRQILSLLEQAQLDELLILPEGAVSGYADDLSFLETVDTGELDSALRDVQQAAQQSGAHLVVGSCLCEGGRWRNAALYFAPDGSQSTYYKVNLATHERGILSAGDGLAIFPMRSSEGIVPVGIQLCREIRFPEQWRARARQEAQVFAYLTYAASPDAPPGVWRSHLISQAAENQRFVVSANTAHRHQHRHQHRPTMLISPRGEVLRKAKTRENTEMIRSVLDLAEVAHWYLDQCRTYVVSLTGISGGE